METRESIGHLESDIKILKNEVQAVLLDLRDKYLEADNPFNAAPAPEITEQAAISGRPGECSEDLDTELHSNSKKRGAKDKGEGSMGLSDSGKETHPETAREEVIQAQMRDETLSGTRPRKSQAPNREISLITIGGLVNWADESVRKLGPQRTEAILDVAEMLGVLSPELKQVMTKFIATDKNGNGEAPSGRVFLDSLVKITTLLGKDNQTEAALLAILSGEDGHG